MENKDLVTMCYEEEWNNTERQNLSVNIREKFLLLLCCEMKWI
jgi:hypothetical protein